MGGGGVSRRVKREELAPPPPQQAGPKMPSSLNVREKECTKNSVFNFEQDWLVNISNLFNWQHGKKGVSLVIHSFF